MLLGGFAVFTAASVACGLAPAIGALIAARAVQGTGAAALGACSLALLNHTFPEPAERARAVGTWTAGGAGSLAAGPLVGGVLIATVGWRSIFFLNVPLGAAGWYLTSRYAGETAPARDRGADLPGQLAAVLGLTALAGATIEAGSTGFRAPTVIGGYLVAVAAGAAFILVERTRARPLLPLRLFRSRTLSVAVVAGLLINVVFYGLIFTFSLFLQRHEGLSPLAAGLTFLPATVLIMASDLIAGRAISVAGTLTAFRQTGSVLGVALYGSLLASMGATAGLRTACAIADRGRQNRAHVRELLWQCQPGLAAALASAEQYLSCQDLEFSQPLTCGAQLRLCLRWLRTTDPAAVCLGQLFE